MGRLLGAQAVSSGSLLEEVCLLALGRVLLLRLGTWFFLKEEMDGLTYCFSPCDHIAKLQN